MSRRKKSRKHEKRHTPLTHHTKEGTRLRPPLGSLKFRLTDWARDLLPEHLWIGSLAFEFGIDRFWYPYNDLLDALDSYVPAGYAALGLISDFGSVPEPNRDRFLKEHEELIDAAFVKPIGRVIAFYPECPARWLVTDPALERDGSLDPEVELGKLRRIVTQLLPGKDPFGGRVRAVPLNRLLKHDKVRFFANLPVVELIPKYPSELSEDDQYHVEAMARQTVGAIVQQDDSPITVDWARYFWRHNFDLVPCRPRAAVLAGARQVDSEEGEYIAATLDGNAINAREYLTLLQERFRPDLYDPRRDEVLFGLFARITRLYCILAEDYNLWARDLAGILLRVLADTAITFGYLARKGVPEDFERFIHYGESQQKLLMLHLQDNYPEERSLEGRTSDEISDELGAFLPEIMEIEVGHWTKKDTRRLASDAGMERLYRLVFAPTSGDVHGNWVSLRESNLTRCAEPLHRFHRLPSFVEPPFFVNTAVAAQSLYEFCRRLGVETLGYPEPLVDMVSFERVRGTDESDEAE